MLEHRRRTATLRTFLVCEGLSFLLWLVASCAEGERSAGPWQPSAGGPFDSGVLDSATCDAAALSPSFAATYIQAHCLPCHSSTLSGVARNGAPDTVNLDSADDVALWASSIRTRAVLERSMPPGSPVDDCVAAALSTYLDGFGPCYADCSGRLCGADGCGGSCGTCAADSDCDASSGRCVMRACLPQCQGLACGSDGCGGSCGTCPSGQACNSSGDACECVPDCSEGRCGSDGCGGSCGTCSGALVCATRTGECVEDCQPDCAGRVCGDDGCGGSCGAACAAGEACDASGECVCAPSCLGRACGDDGCGGSCGTCTVGTSCNGSGQCSCAPTCSDRVCGDDGCGGSCGTCESPTTCVAGQCQIPCVPDCAGRSCGDDGCGGSCGVCASGQTCGAGACAYPIKYFAGDVYPIFQNAGCGTNTCHAGAKPAQGLDLSSVASAYGSLLGAASVECSARVLVKVGEPSASYLVNKLSGTDMCTGSRMPKSRPALSASQLDVVRSWIGSGAAN